jgi:hypothetical protein
VRASSVTEEDEAARPRQQVARLGSQRSHCASAPPERERKCYSFPSEVLGDVAAIGDEQLQRSKATAAPDAKASQHESVDDAPRGADLDDDSEAQPHRNARSAARLGHQEHERIVVPGLRSPRQLGRHVQGCAPAYRECKSWRSDRDPRPSAVLARACDSWPPAEIEREAGALHGHDRRLTARIDHLHGRGPGSVEPHVCRGRRKRDRSKQEPEWGHRPIAVKVTVAV